VLNEDEIRLVWKALDDESPLIAALFRIRLLTAQRGGEVHGAAWSEFDLATGWWTIPAERSKNGLAHRVPLSPQAVRILKTWREMVDDSPWFFRAHGRKARTSPMRRRRSNGSFGAPGSTSEGMTCGAPRQA
jgi:integrase